MKLPPTTKNSNGHLLEKDGFNYHPKVLDFVKEERVPDKSLIIFSRLKKQLKKIEYQSIKHKTQHNRIISQLFSIAFEWTLIS
jgi:hypothetical protein